MSNTQLQVLAQSSELFIDGSFKYAVTGYAQVYRVFGLIESTVCMPVAIIVMKSKLEYAYKKIFK